MNAIGLSSATNTGKCGMALISSLNVMFAATPVMRKAARLAMSGVLRLARRRATRSAPQRRGTRSQMEPMEPSNKNQQATRNASPVASNAGRLRQSRGDPMRRRRWSPATRVTPFVPHEVLRHG